MNINSAYSIVCYWYAILNCWSAISMLSRFHIKLLLRYSCLAHILSECHQPAIMMLSECYRYAMAPVRCTRSTCYLYDINMLCLCYPFAIDMLSRLKHQHYMNALSLCLDLLPAARYQYAIKMKSVCYQRTINALSINYHHADSSTITSQPVLSIYYQSAMALPSICYP